MMRYIWQILLLCAVICGGCAGDRAAIGSYYATSGGKKAFRSENQEKISSYDGIERRPVVVIHGYLGARLRETKSGSVIWGEIPAIEAIRRYTPHHLRSLALPMCHGKTLRALRDGLEPDGLLRYFQVNVGSLQYDVSGYENLVKVLNAAGYRTELDAADDANLFLFAYDWRRDIAENAAELGRFLQKRQAILQDVYFEKYGIRDYPVKFDLVGHSMGGLLIRYFLRKGQNDLPEEESAVPQPDWSGAALTARAILIGTPNYGYPDACKELVNGLDYAPGAAVYPAAVIGTFPSCYQMMPPAGSGSVVADAQTGKVLDPLDPDVWIRYQWGLLNPKQDPILKILLPDVLTREARYAVALDHLKKCLSRARKFQKAMRYLKEPPPGVETILLLGDSIETSRRLALDPATGLLKVIASDSGDGKVPTLSARGDMRFVRNVWYPHELPLIPWKHVIHLPGSHMGILNTASFQDNLIYYLQTAPDLRQSGKVPELREFLEK